MTPRYGVLDIETQKMFSEVGGKSKLHDLKISVAGFYDSKDDAYTAFEEKQLHELEVILKELDVLVGFNVRKFDLPVLQPYILSDIASFPVLDILEEVHKVRGHRVTLQSLVTATLNDTKSGKGHDAVQLFRDGRMQELKKYCLDDVRLTKEIFDYGMQHGTVRFRSGFDFKVHEIQAAWKDLTPFLKKKEAGFPSGLF